MVNATLDDLARADGGRRRVEHGGEPRFSGSSARWIAPPTASTKVFDLRKTERKAGNRHGRVRFIKLELKDRSGRLVSDNFYWQAPARADLRNLAVDEQGKRPRHGPKLQQGNLANSRRRPQPNRGVALMTRLKVVDDASGLLAAPIMYSDDYFSLVPGETKQ